MTTHSSPSLLARNGDWQYHLRTAIRSSRELLEALGLSLQDTERAAAAAEDFPVRVPRPFLQRMTRGNPNDPLLLQVLAMGDETLPIPGFVADPLEEAEHNPLPGLIHKYESRVLLMPTAACAVHCRYCFRRHFPYSDNRLDPEALANIFAYIRTRPEINEVILSGGDPLVLDDEALSDLIDGIEALPQISRLRIHSRLPVVIPERLTRKLAQRLAMSRLAPVLVIHCNHAQEIDTELATALQVWRNAGITLLNQSVLLRGVNDSAVDQIALAERLFEAEVLPYYLHLLDPVAGTAHFEVPDTEALALHQTMRDALPGFLLPRLVREVPGEGAKRTLS